MDKIEETSNKQTVGINIDNVRYNCSKISDNYYEVTEKIIQEVGEFFYLLSQVWASNKAINFGAIMEKEINYALNDIKKESFTTDVENYISDRNQNRYGHRCPEQY